MEFHKIMVDSSVWIDFFKSGNSSASKLLVEKLEEDKVCICGIIELEIIQGLKDKEKYEVMNCLEILEYIETTKEDYRTAGRTVSDLRKKGITVAPADAIIATLCIKNNLTLISFDKDYNHFPALRKKIFSL